MTVTRHPDTLLASAPTIVTVPEQPDVALVTVHRDGRTVGAYVLGNGKVRYRPVVDLGDVLSAATAMVTVVAIGAAVAVARRRPPAVRAVTMGPGGWVSFRGTSAPALRQPANPRPWWARLLRARRLVVEG